MLLNIDKVLRLLAEGKDIYKISENSDLSAEDIALMIEDARNLLIKTSGNKVRKKVIIKNKKKAVATVSDDLFDIFEGAEVNAIPLNTQLVFNIAVASADTFYKTAMYVYTEDEKQLAKLHFKIQESEERPALAESLRQAVKIAEYFKASSAKFRIDDKFVFEIISKDVHTDDEKLSEKISLLKNEMEDKDHFRIEFINKFANEKTNYLASQRIKSKRPKM